MKTKLQRVFLTVGIVLSSVGCGQADDTRNGIPAQASFETSRAVEKKVKIHIKTEKQTLVATLEDNATSRDFVSLLPLTITLEDYAGTEKISRFSRKLSVDGAPAGYDPSIGDLAYYAPWGNLAIFYKDFGYSNSLIHLGQIDSGIEVLSGSGSVPVTIEVIE